MHDLPLYWIALIGFLVINVMLVSASVLVYAERKVSGWIQNRPGPNRVGPGGFLQPFADVAKLVFKEDIEPAQANGFVHSLAPVLMVVIAMTTAALIPFARGVVIIDTEVSALMVLALTSISVYGITLAGWSSNSKFSLLGGLRSSAQMISYELVMGLSVVTVVLITGSMRLVDIVEAQGYACSGVGLSGLAGCTDVEGIGLGILGWNVFRAPVACILFIVTAFAETNRAPFDLPEAEQELVGGYHTEYSGMKFGMFFLAEYVNFFIASFLIVTLFFGGYLVPFFDAALTAALHPVLMGFVHIVTLLLKAAFFAFLFIWVRWTLPRFKYDQLMQLGWKALLPIAIANVVLYAVAIIVIKSIW
jgi:NADH-quinone oxidoreductase subunit H